METLVDLLREAAARYGDRPALSAHAGLRDLTWSYRRLWDAAGAVAGQLRDELGLAPGTPVIAWAPNSPELVALFFGVMRARLVLVPIDPSATPAFVTRVAAATDAGLVVGAASRPDGCGAPYLPLGEFRYEGNPPPTDEPPRADDAAEVVFTSGTTGTPKGVVLTHRNIVANMEAVLRLAPRRPHRLLSLLPLSHMFEQTVGLYSPLAVGSTIHYPSSRRGPVLLKAMRRHAVTALVVVPQALELMLRSIETEMERRGRAPAWRWALRVARWLPLRLRRVLFHPVHRGLGGHLSMVICGGAPLPGRVFTAWERMGVRVMEGYGTTECAPIVTANTHSDRAPGTVGRPVPGVEVRLSAVGEILVRGPNVFPGYWGEQAAPGRRWYHTGDSGGWDDHGRLRVTGRLADRIVLPSGLNVYPEDVEYELAQEPEVADCVVVAMTDDAGRPHLHAAIIPAAPGRGVAALEAAVRRANARLAPHQRVTGITVWTDPDFPRTQLRKVKRFEVEAFLAARATGSLPAPAAEPAAAGATLDRVRRLLTSLSRQEGADISRESDLTLDIGLDSLALVELAVALEDEFGIVVEDGDLAALDTVAALCELVERSAPPPPAAPAPAWPWRQPARVVRAVIHRAVLFPLHRLVARPFVIEGTGHLADVTGPVLLIANHSSHLDTPSILRALPGRLRRRTAVAAAADYFFRSRPAGAATALVLGAFPFSREGAVRSSLERCGELIDDGCSVLIYPEGTRSVTGEPAPFRSGTGLLAAELGVPVVPICVAGSHAAWPKGARRPRPGPITVRIGTPLHIAPAAGRRETTVQLEDAVAALAAGD